MSTQLDDYGDPIECLDAARGDCTGAVEYRPSLSGTGTPIPRCDHHWELRLDEQDAINERYPDSDLPPAWFHAGPGGTNEYGERWDDD